MGTSSKDRSTKYENEVFDMRTLICSLLLVVLSVQGVFAQVTVDSIVDHVDLDGDGVSAVGEQMVLEWWLENELVSAADVIAAAVSMPGGTFSIIGIVPQAVEPNPTDPVEPGLGGAGIETASSMIVPVHVFDATLACVFVRGNTNTAVEVSTAVDLADGVYLLAYLFSGGPAPVNMDAADVNDDGLVNVVDASYIFDYVTGGSAPLSPFPNDGYDLTPDGLEVGCDNNYRAARNKAIDELGTTLALDLQSMASNYHEDITGDEHRDLVFMSPGSGVAPAYSFGNFTNANGGEFQFLSNFSNVDFMIPDDSDSFGDKELVLIRSGVLDVLSAGDVTSGVVLASYPCVLPVEAVLAPELGIGVLHDGGSVTIYRYTGVLLDPYFPVLMPQPLDGMGQPILFTGLEVVPLLGGGLGFEFSGSDGRYYQVASSYYDPQDPYPDVLDESTTTPYKSYPTRNLPDPIFPAGSFTPQTCCASVATGPYSPTPSSGVDNPKLRLNWTNGVEAYLNAGAGIGVRDGRVSLALRQFSIETTMTLPGSPCLAVTAGLAQEVYHNQAQVKYYEGVTGIPSVPYSEKCRYKNVGTIVGSVRLWDNVSGDPWYPIGNSHGTLTAGSSRDFDFSDSPNVSLAPGELPSRFRRTSIFLVRTLTHTGENGFWFESGNRNHMQYVQNRLKTAAEMGITAADLEIDPSVNPMEAVWPFFLYATMMGTAARQLEEYVDANPGQPTDEVWLDVQTKDFYVSSYTSDDGFAALFECNEVDVAGEGTDEVFPEAPCGGW